jgi:catechol 2,3-dioxygenase-like lactoylglutathione lyase family enzyme
MSSPVQVRRFLHCNYNCRDVANLEHFYIELFGLRTVMRSSSRESDGTPFGLYGRTSTETAFLYDHRGGRRANSFELVQWIEPQTFGAVYPNPWDRGIQSAGFSASDLDAVATNVTRLGGSIVRRGEEWLLFRDPEGVAIEVIRADGPTEARHLRIVCSDLERTMAWWSQLGFSESPGLVALPGNQVWPDHEQHAISAECGMVATDDPTFGVIFTTWSGPSPTGPTYAVPYHQGIYRMAMAVDDVHAAYESLMTLGIPRQPPYTFQLPGTKLTDGLTILFIREPDGILVELVDRPRLNQ